MAVMIMMTIIMMMMVVGGDDYDDNYHDGDDDGVVGDIARHWLILFLQWAGGNRHWLCDVCLCFIVFFTAAILAQLA